jgi:hypothetical protein
LVTVFFVIDQKAGETIADNKLAKPLLVFGSIPGSEAYTKRHNKSEEMGVGIEFCPQ